MNSHMLGQFVIANWYLFLALAVVLVLIALPAIQQLLYRVEGVSPAKAVQLLNREKAVVIDVRPADEFAKGHIAGARSLPLADIGKALPAPIAKLKSRPVIVCCATGERSRRAAAALARQGFERTYNLAGGLSAWRKEHLPIEA